MRSAWPWLAVSFAIAFGAERYFHARTEEMLAVTRRNLRLTELQVELLELQLRARRVELRLRSDAQVHRL